MRYHRRFRHIHPRTISATRTLVSGWSGKTEAEQWEAMRTWLREVSSVYGFTPPTLVKSAHAGYGFYRPVENRIYMVKPSIVTVLHEFRHAMQYDTPVGIGMAGDEFEEDARGWSLSLYYKVAPRTMRRLVEQGRIFFLTPADMS